MNEKQNNGDRFLVKHIGTTASSGGELMGFFHAGINYHVEHHLFPRINHLNLPKIQPIIREFCAERGIHYNYFPTMWDNIKSFVTHLYILGSKDAYEHLLS